MRAEAIGYLAGVQGQGNGQRAVGLHGRSYHVVKGLAGGHRARVRVTCAWATYRAADRLIRLKRASRRDGLKLRLGIGLKLRLG